MTDFFVFMPARLLNVEAKALEHRKVLGKPAKPFIDRLDRSIFGFVSVSHCEWLIGAPADMSLTPKISSTGWP